MNIEKLREELKVDEGCINEIYLDHLGYYFWNRAFNNR